MKYLGSISGTGMLLCDGIAFADASYEIDGFMRIKGQISGTGEIGLEAGLATDAMAHETLQLRTNDGQVLDLTVADTKKRTPNRILVDVSAGLPAAGDWLH